MLNIDNSLFGEEKQRFEPKPLAKLLLKPLHTCQFHFHVLISQMTIRESFSKSYKGYLFLFFHHGLTANTMGCLNSIYLPLHLPKV